MLYSTSPRPNGEQSTPSPLGEAVVDADSQPSANSHQTLSEPKKKRTTFHAVGEPRPLPPKLRYIEGIPILPHPPPPEAAGHPKRALHLPPRPRPQPPSRLQYSDGLPVLPRTETELAAVRAGQPPVYFRDHTRGRCIHCVLTASPCTFTKVTPSTPCGRCRRLGRVCMIRRPGTARRIVTGDEAGDWVPVQRAVEEAVGEDGARALAEGAMRESEEGGTRAVFGDRFGAKDVGGWCLPRVVRAGEGGDGFWRRVLKGKEVQEVDRSSRLEAIVEIGEGIGCSQTQEGWNSDHKS